MPGPYNIPEVSYGGDAPDPVEWANDHVGPAVDDLHTRAEALEAGKVDNSDPRLSDARTPTTHTHTSAGVTDFTEAVQDAVAALLAAGTNITLNYNDAGNTLTVTAAGGSFDAEAARDALGVALVGVGNISIVVNDALDTITISTTATVNSTDAQLRDRSTHTGTQAQSTVTDLVTDLAAKAPLTSPTFTGDPKAPTPATGDNDTSIATTAFVKAQGYAAGGHIHDFDDVVLLEVTLDSKIPKSLVDAKGDLIAATANDTPARVAIGADGTFLKADSTAAAGVSWDTPAGGGSGGTGDVQFVVARVGTSINVSSDGFNTYPLDGTPSVNIGGGSWNGTTFVYTVPETGLYLCVGAIRGADAMTARSVALAIGTSNADGPHVLWGAAGGSGADSRDGRQYTRIVRFTSGDLVRMYIYSESLNFPTMSGGAGQYMSLVKIAD
jgi:hypothetical protein